MVPPPDTETRHAASRSVADAQTRAQVAKLELTVTRRIDGVLLGDYQGLIPGPGAEPGEARHYEVGDDVRAMDWAVTARTTEPHVRQTIADRELETWLLVDLSPTLTTGGAGEGASKCDLVVAACATFGFLSARAGNRVGVVIVGAGAPHIVPPAGGKAHARAIVEAVAVAAEDVTNRKNDQRRRQQQTAERGDQKANRPAAQVPPKTTPTTWWKRLWRTRSERPGPPADSALEEGIRLLRGLCKRRGMVVLISDFLGPRDWERSLRVLAPRQELLAVRVTDPLDVALPLVGSAMLQDTMTGELVDVNVGQQQALDYAAAARAGREQVVAALRRCGAPVLAMRTDRDWVRAVIEFTGMRRQGAFPDGERILSDIGGSL